MIAANDQVITAVRLAEPLKIDGMLNEELYRTPAYGDFIQEDPDNGQPISEKTEYWVAYDGNALYVAARLHDNNPEEIVTRMVRRDANFDSDVFQIAIDSYNDNRSGFYFEVNPSGSKGDGIVYNDSWTDDSWDGIWKQAATIDAEGWSVEIRIPFSQLRFNYKPEITMGIGCGRVIKRKNEQGYTFPVPRGESGIMSRLETLIVVKDITPPKRVELVPYLTGNAASLPSKDDNPYFNGHDNSAAVGTDIKLGIGNNLTADATINPDFGQVESDPSVINLTAYETIYDEKRPFFVEGSNIFEFGYGGPSNNSNFNYSRPSFFYSRRIGRQPQIGPDDYDWQEAPEATTILGAAKISGKLPGNIALGGLTALTQQEFVHYEKDSLKYKQEAEPQTNYNLWRVQKEFNDSREGLGGLVTYVDRQFDDTSLRSSLTDNALGIGIDGWTFFNDERKWALGYWAGYTRVSGSKDKMLGVQESYNHYFQKPGVKHVEVDSNLTILEGYAGRLNFNHEKGRLIFNSALAFTSPGFESNDLGVTSRTDLINQHTYIGYKWLEPTKYYRYWYFWVAEMSNHNYGGDLLNNMYFFEIEYGLPNYWGWWHMTGWGPRTLDQEKLRGGPLVASTAGQFHEIGFWSDGRKDLYGDGFIGYSFGEIGYWEKYCDFDLTLKLGPRFSISSENFYSNSHGEAQYVTTIDDPVASYMYGKRYIVSDIDRKTFESSLRFEYTFTPNLTFQAYLQNLLATGEYNEFKEYAKPRSMEFIYYAEEDLEIREDEDGNYFVVETDQPLEHAIDNDFNYKSLVGTAVLRWEFRPGSIFYVVWSGFAENDEDPGDFSFGRDLGNLWQTDKDNILAIKLTWWLGR